MFLYVHAISLDHIPQLFPFTCYPCPSVPTFSLTLSLYFPVSPLQDSTQERRHVMLVLPDWLNVMTSSRIHFLGQLDVIEQ